MATDEEEELILEASWRKCLFSEVELPQRRRLTLVVDQEVQSGVEEVVDPTIGGGMDVDKLLLA